MPRTPPVGRRFQPGQSGNPSGGKKHNKLKREIKSATLPDVLKSLNELIHLDPAKLNEWVKEDPKLYKTNFAAALTTDIRKGNADTLIVIMERLYGKPKEHLQMTGLDGDPIQAEVSIAEETVKGILEKLHNEY